VDAGSRKLPDDSAIKVLDELRQLAFDVSRVAGIGALAFLGRPRCGEPDGCCLRVDLLPAPILPDKHARK
jgi:hypothetical protein